MIQNYWDYPDKNEDLHIERVIRNIVNFCDSIIITDHLSDNHTCEIVEINGSGIPPYELKKMITQANRIESINTMTERPETGVISRASLKSYLDIGSASTGKTKNIDMVSSLKKTHHLS